MAVSLTRFSWWLWGGKEKEPLSNGSFSNLSSGDSCLLRDPADSVKFSSKNFTSGRKVKRKWKSKDQERRKIDEEYGDAVLVPPDGEIFLPGLESDGPDWSIGWVEPHGRGFRTDYDDAGKTDDGFAVLVPCYKPGCKELVAGSNNQLLIAVKNLPNGLSYEGRNYMEWLSSLQSY